MAQDKYSAVWVSNSSMGDFMNCPRLYYLRNVYKDPNTRHKINIVNPALALGQSVHEVLEALSLLPVEERFTIPLLTTYNEVWKKVSGKLGGFHNDEEEAYVKERGAKMLKRVMDHPGPILRKAIKIQKELPNYYLSEEENIILCGKIDWLEDGTKFDSSVDRDKAFETPIGVGYVIKGWDLGVVGMKVGGKRKLTIPSDLGYGNYGVEPDIPPFATLIFEVELLKIK